MATEVWTYIGRRTDGAGIKLWHYWLDPEGMTLGFSKRFLGYEAVGQQFELEVTRQETGEASVVLKKGSYIGQSEDSRRTEWRAEDLAAATLVDSRRTAQRDAEEEDVIRKALEPVRKEYRKLPAPGRRALLAYVLEVLSS